MEKLSTGKRINFAKDDAAGTALAMRLDSEISGLAVASRNASDGQSLIDTADGALKESHASCENERTSRASAKWNVAIS